jgi:hypothetical protein
MAQPLLKRLLNSPSKKRGDKRGAERQAYIGGELPGMRREMPFMKSNDPWTVERKERQEVITKQYLSDKKKFITKRRSAQNELKRNLKREKAEVDHYYRLKKLKESDPKWEKARRDARHKYELIERKMMRKHRDFWHKQERTMQMGRDKQRRKVTKQMMKEYRRARGSGDNTWGAL